MAAEAAVASKSGPENGADPGLSDSIWLRVSVAGLPSEHVVWIAHGYSISDGIDPEFCSLHHTTAKDTAEIITMVRPGALLMKFDIEFAYRLCTLRSRPCIVKD